MKLHKVWSWVALAFITGVVSESGYSQAPSNLTYTVIDLGGLRTDGTGTSEAHAIDSHGDVVGVADAESGFQHAFIWKPDTGMIKDLQLFGNGQFTAGGDNSAAYGISYAAAGNGNSTAIRYVVGEGNPPALSTGNEHALYLGPAGLVDLNGTGDFSSGPLSAASAVNTNGVATGWAVKADNVGYFAFRSMGSTLQDLGTLPGGNLSVGVAINNLGDVAGSSDDTNGISWGVVWSHSGGTPVKISGMTTATGINDHGLVVGRLNATVGDGVQAVYSLGSGGAVPLAALSNLSCVAWGVNNHGQIVGATGSGTVIRSPGITTGVFATLWNGSNSVVDLNTRITAAGWHLATAEAINDAGQIVGAGFHNGIKRAFLLTLPPSISSPTVAPGELLPAGGVVTISAVVSNNLAATPVSADLSGAAASTVTLAAQPDDFYTGTFNAPANSSTNTQTYAVNLHAGSGPTTSAGTITVDGISSGLLKVSSTNLVFKTTTVGKKATLAFKLQNAGPLHSAPLRIKINGPFTSFGLLAFKSQLPASSRATVAADGSVWLSLARGKTVVVTITFQPFSKLLVGDQLTISPTSATRLGFEFFCIGVLRIC